jgi:hypothetical protein
MRKKCKIAWIDWGIVSVNEKEALCEFIKAHYVFRSKHEERGKRPSILTIGRALQRFRHALNKFYVQPDVSPFNRVGFITINERNTFQQPHTTPEATAHINRMKELIQKNKFKHRLGPDGYKAAIPLWTKKEQELREAGIPDPLHLKILHKLPLLLKIHHLHNLLSIILLGIVLLRMIILQSITSHYPSSKSTN